MKRLAFIAFFIVSIIAIFRIAYPSVTLRYQFTLDVEFNGERKAGSGVIEVSYSKNPQFLGASAEMTTAVEGQAVWVDLGERDALFALPTSGRHPRSGPEDIIPVLFGVTTDGFGPEAFDRIAALKGQRDVPFELLPLMVRLRNVDDPKSAEMFDPAAPAALPTRELRLVRATIEIVPTGVWPLNFLGITGVPISRGITAKLPWLAGFKGYTGGQLSLDRSRPEKNLTGDDFVKGSVR